MSKMIAYSDIQTIIDDILIYGILRRVISRVIFKTPDDFDEGDI